MKAGTPTAGKGTAIPPGPDRPELGGHDRGGLTKRTTRLRPFSPNPRRLSVIAAFSNRSSYNFLAAIHHAAAT